MLITALFTIAKTQKQPKCKYPLKKDWIKKSNTYIYACVCVCVCEHAHVHTTYTQLNIIQP